MPTTSRETTTEVETGDGFEARLTELDGYTVVFETITEAAGSDRELSELSDEPSAVPRWGYVIKGRLGARFDGSEETAEAGDAYFFPAGHTLVSYPGTELVEFSPSQD